MPHCCAAVGITIQIAGWNCPIAAGRPQQTDRSARPRTEPTVRLHTSVACRGLKYQLRRPGSALQHLEAGLKVPILIGVQRQWRGAIGLAVEALIISVPTRAVHDA